MATQNDNTKSLYSEDIPSLQSKAYATDKMVGDKFVKAGSGPLVSEGDRKTGEVSPTASRDLQDYGMAVH